jgi:cell division protein FtsL
VAATTVQTDAGQKRGLGVGAFVLALATLGAVAHVGVRMKGIEVAYDLGREKQINQKLEEERRRLNIEIGMLKDPVRVVSFARDKLKMGPPAPTDIVRLGPGTVIGARAPESVDAPKPKKAIVKVTAKPAALRAKVEPKPEPVEAQSDDGRGEGAE